MNRETKINEWLDENRTGLSEYEMEERFETSLREIYGAVSVCGMIMDAARLLRNNDEPAWREGFNAWLDSEDWKEIDGKYYSASDYTDAENAVDEMEAEEAEAQE